MVTWTCVGCWIVRMPHHSQILTTLTTLAMLAPPLPQAWGNLGPTVYDGLQVPDGEVVWCAVAIGYPDTSAAVNTLRSAREPVDAVASFRGFPSKL